MSLGHVLKPEDLGVPEGKLDDLDVSWTDDRRSRVNPLKDMWKVVREALTIRKNLRTGVYELPAGAEPAIS